MGNARIWLFRVLVVVALVAVVATWFTSWWSMDIDKVGPRVMHIYPTGVHHSLTAEYFALAHGQADMPAWFTPFAWAFFAFMMVGLISSLWLKDIRGRLILAAVGLGYFFTPVVMAVVAYIKLQAAGMPLQGDGSYSAGGYYNSLITTRLDPGWYMALGVGAFIVLLAVLRDRIVGKPKPSKQEAARPASTLATNG